MNTLFFLFLCIFFHKTVCLELINQWNFFSFDFPLGFESNNFRPENNVMTGIEVTDDKIFILTPRLRAGVAATVATIPKDTPKGSSPILQAYPNWSFHNAANGDYNCSGLISVYRTRLDTCKNLWILDAGTVESLDNFRRVCPPKILIFDLKTDEILKTIVFPNEVLRPISTFTNLIIDESIKGKCESSYVYISDTVAPGLVVYDGASGNTWRFTDPTMFPNPDYASMNIVGNEFSLMDGIIGLAHSPQTATLYYQPLATDRIFSVPTATLIKGPPAEFEEFPVTTVGRKSSQGLPLGMNKNDNTLYFSPLSETSLASWNVVNNQQEVIANDPTNLQFIAEIKWQPEDGSIYILSSKFQRFFRRTVSGHEVNLRILRVPPRTASSNIPRFNDIPRYNPLYSNYFK